jgi:hypothetical protein
MPLPESARLPVSRCLICLASAETGQQRLKMISNSVPLGRLTPNEIAKAVGFSRLTEEAWAVVKLLARGSLD